MTIRKKKKSRKKSKAQHSRKFNKSAVQNISLSNEQAMQLAIQHLQAGKLQQAEHLIQQLLNIDPDNSEANHILGVIFAQQEGKSELAIHHIEKAIQVNPNNAAFHHNLGRALDDLGRIEDAIPSYRKALAINPDYAEAHNNLGVVLQESNRIDEAITSFRKAIAINPDFAEAHHNLGFALNKSGMIEDAIASYRKALSINPSIVKAHINLGVALQKSSRMDEAISSFRKALAINPDYAEAYNYLGMVFRKSNRMDEALASLNKAININPDYAEAYTNLGSVYYEAWMLDEAIASHRKALAINPDYAEAYNYLGLTLQRSNRTEDAIINYRKALSLKPDLVDAYSNMGRAYQELGRMDEAIVNHKKGLSLDKKNVGAIFGISLIMKYSEHNDFIQRTEDLYAQEDIDDESKTILGFVLGKFFEGLKEYEKAFGFFLEANRLRRKIFEYSIQGEQDVFERVKKTFSPAFFSAHHGSGSQDRTPIFILGMPRSGTTLVEQILASHPLVFGAGELMIITKLLHSIFPEISSDKYPECVADFDAEMFTGMGSDYINELRKYSKDAKYITDKMPHNFQYVGLIKTVLPKAKVIHCMRNPMDNCLSIFKSLFVRFTHTYSNDMAEIGRYYNLYFSLMEHWEKVLPGYMYNIRYEEMVADQENQTRKLLEFCGLPWDEACLAFHKTDRKVNTLSSVQVRQPMYKDSVELWKRYEKQLEPLHKVIYGE